MPRSTNDYDLNIFLPESKAQEVFDCLAPLGVASDATSLATVEKTGQVRLNWGDQKVDLFFAYAPFHESVAARVRKEEVRDQQITVLSAEDIVIFKVIFNRPLDWRDLERLFQQGTSNLDLEYVYRWLVGLLGDDDGRILRLRETIIEAGRLMASSD
jgi:hypothetical protein